LSHLLELGKYGSRTCFSASSALKMRPVSPAHAPAAFGVGKAGPRSRACFSAWFFHIVQPLEEDQVRQLLDGVQRGWSARPSTGRPQLVDLRAQFGVGEHEISLFTGRRGF